MKTIPRILLCLSATLLLLAGACHPTARRSTAALLDDVESYINDRPDSALAVLRGLDSTTVRGRALRARCALQHTMALDKCYIDLQTDSILAPAVAWYERHGSPDDKLKTQYYLGRIYQNQGNIEQTAVSFSNAESYIKEAKDDKIKGLLFLAESVLYRDTFNSDKEIESIRQGAFYFREIGDTININRVDARLAMAYHRKKDWQTADSLFRVGLSRIQKDSVFYSAVLSDYARMKVLQPEPDPSGALLLLHEKRAVRHQAFRVADVGTYTFASVLQGIGDSASLKPYTDYLRSIEGPDQKDALYWLYRIAQDCGESDQAIKAMNKAYLAQLDIYEKTLNNSVSTIILKQKESINETIQRRLRYSNAFISLLIFIFVILSCVFYLLASKQRLQKEMLYQEREHKLEQYAATVSDLESRLSTAIKKNHSAMDLGFDTMDRLCECYYTSGHVKSHKLLDSFEILLQRFRKDEDYQRAFQDSVDATHGGILTKMRQQLVDFQKEDFELLALVISGLSYNSISVILNTNKPNTYNRVTRLRHRIEKSGAPDKDVFIDALRKVPSFNR